MEITDTTPIITAEVLATQLGKDKKMINYLVKAGIINPQKTGRNRLYSKEDADIATAVLEHCPTKEAIKGFKFFLKAEGIDGDVNKALDMVKQAKQGE